MPLRKEGPQEEREGAGEKAWLFFPCDSCTHPAQPPGSVDSLLRVQQTWLQRWAGELHLCVGNGYGIGSEHDLAGLEFIRKM